jgi:hypothetical protein
MLQGRSVYCIAFCSYRHVNSFYTELHRSKSTANVSMTRWASIKRSHQRRASATVRAMTSECNRRTRLRRESGTSTSKPNGKVVCSIVLVSDTRHRLMRLCVRSVWRSSCTLWPLNSATSCRHVEGMKRRHSPVIQYSIEIRGRIRAPPASIHSHIDYYSLRCHSGRGSSGINHPAIPFGAVVSLPTCRDQSTTVFPAENVRTYASTSQSFRPIPSAG